MKIEIREAIIEDSQMLFDWANDIETRQNSFNSQMIELKDHINWLTKRLTDPLSKIYIVSYQDQAIGVVRFEKSNHTTIGITVAPYYRGRGIGFQILTIACRKYWENNNDEILAYVKVENIASKRVFEKAGFSFLNLGEVNNFKCLILKATKNAH